ncbi:hypothetical protein GCK72_015097 [Caenorhabditis remanei]|uniref:Uncharacterized protein n=1 Tax=Caenorhabditis remanei TaxID=31234 RepID=A0A6A5GT36_CAERE|nr:hypothetical protein GCK72_015097 [Caenorhabditis remanei]KAF1758638.1 hypothetical protein GCK72_015097 [Caenorhabditis remanei]
MCDIDVVGCLESYSFVYLLFCENLVSREHWVEEPAHVVGIEKYGFGEKRRVYGVQNRDGDCQPDGWQQYDDEQQHASWQEPCGRPFFWSNLGRVLLRQLLQQHLLRILRVRLLHVLGMDTPPLAPGCPGAPGRPSSPACPGGPRGPGGQVLELGEHWHPPPPPPPPPYPPPPPPPCPPPYPPPPPPPPYPPPPCPPPY